MVHLGEASPLVLVCLLGLPVVCDSMSLAYSPMGSEFVSGSYDKTLRIFPVQGAGKSREVYHTRRMQRIFSVAFTGDAKFVLSASDDTNVRVWKAQKSDKLGRVRAVSI